MNNIISEIQKSNNIVLLCHRNPDGDAIGSTLALYHALIKLDKEVDIIINDVPERFTFIEGYNQIKNSSNKEYNLGVILDTANIDRVNNPGNILENIERTIVIDHHISNTKYGDVNYVDESPACCQIIYNLIKDMNIEIDNQIGVPLVTGLLTDTGGFAHSNVTDETFLVAASLSKVVNVSDIYKKVLGTITKSQFKLKQKTMDNLEFYENGQIAFSYITSKDIEQLGATYDECDILVNIGREIEGVEISIFARIYPEEIRVSLRSSNVDVCSIAQVFGGGGHINASGITTNMDFDILKEKIIKEAGKKINEWNFSGRQA
ncbi:MAG: bifunctional oligoribonuclease/PAP phosphatase NrnA [Bacilli bacterium]